MILLRWVPDVILREHKHSWEMREAASVIQKDTSREKETVVV